MLGPMDSPKYGLKNEVGRGPSNPLGQAGGRRRLHWAYGPPLTQRVGRRAKPGASNGSGHKPLGQAASFAGKSYSDT
jgi:hypothetical protein